MTTIGAEAVVFGDVAGHPVVVTVTVVVLSLIVAAQAFPKIAGPLRQGIEQWTMSRRRAQDAAKAGVLGDLEAELDRYQELVRDLRVELSDRRTETARHGEVLTVHARWDQRSVIEAMKHGVDLGPVPPLYAICPDTSAAIAPERTT